MEGGYEFFSRSEAESSDVLAASLGVSDAARERIDGLFAFLLSKHESFRTFDAALRLLPNEAQSRTKLEKELGRKYLALNLKEFATEARIYALAKTILYYNIIQTAFLKKDYVDTIFALNLAAAFSELESLQSLNGAQLAAASIYVACAPVISHNGFVLERLFLLQKKSEVLSRCNDEQRGRILRSWLEIYQNYDLYGDLKAFNKILSFAKGGEILPQLARFEAKNAQGCMKMLQILLRSEFEISGEQGGADAREFELKKRLVLLFGSARGAMPNAAWLKQLAHIKEMIGERAIKGLASEILKLKNYERLHLLKNGKETKFGSSDDIAKGFLKAATWVREEEEFLLRAAKMPKKAPDPQKIKRELKARLEGLLDAKNSGRIDLKTYILSKKEIEAQIKELGG